MDWSGHPDLMPYDYNTLINDKDFMKKEIFVKATMDNTRQIVESDLLPEIVQLKNNILLEVQRITIFP